MEKLGNLAQVIELKMVALYLNPGWLLTPSVPRCHKLAPLERILGDGG